MDGVLRRRGGVLERLLHHEGEPVLVRVAQTAPDASCSARARSTRGPRRTAIARMRFALGVDEDLRAFHRRFARDPLIGRSLRRRPWLRVAPAPGAVRGAGLGDLRAADRVRARGRDRAPPRRRARAALGRLGRRRQRAARPARAGGARGHGAGAAASPSTSAGARAIALVRAAREVARGRVDLHGADHERGWRRLRAIPGIGTWTVEMLALHGQGRHDQVPGGRPRPAEARRAPAQRRRSARARARSTRCASSSRPTGSGRGWRRRTPGRCEAAPPARRVLAQDAGVADRVAAGLRPDAQAVRALADRDAVQQPPGARWRSRRPRRCSGPTATARVPSAETPPMSGEPPPGRRHLAIGRRVREGDHA